MTVEDAKNDQYLNATPADEQSQQPFITLPFDEDISFDSPQDLLTWIKKDKGQFDSFRRNSLSYKSGSNSEKDIIEFPNDIVGLIGLYEAWYYRALEISDDIFKLQHSDTTPVTLEMLSEKKENLIRYWTDFTNEGLVPMQSSIGRCAYAMSCIKEDPRLFSNSPDSNKQGIAWLHAMTALRKQQSQQQPKITEIKKKIAEDHELLASLEERIKNSEHEIQLYDEKISAFREKALKEAASKSPADALTLLEAAHGKAAKWYFGLAAATIIIWILFVIFYYYPHYAAPLLDKTKDEPLGAGAMLLLTSMALTGIMATLAIILLRLGVSRVNFSVAAGERKAMASAYRALLIEDAITNDQQLIFLQSIVGRDFPSYVDSNGIPTLQDTLGTAVKTLRGSNTSGQ